jgi:hypothetical protein
VKRALAVVLASCVACGGQRPLPETKAAVVPLGYRVNLVTMRDCRYLGPVTNGLEADALGANVVLVFVQESHESSYNGATTKSIFWSRGKAMLCPPQVLQNLLRPEGVVG